MPRTGRQIRVPACEPSSYIIPTTSNERLAAALIKSALRDYWLVRHRQPTLSLYGARKRAHSLQRLDCKDPQFVPL
jgi:hypothetical protein